MEPFHINRNFFIALLSKDSQRAGLYFDSVLPLTETISVVDVNHYIRLGLLNYPNTSHLRMYLTDDCHGALWIQQFLRFIAPVFSKEYNQ